MCSTSSLWVWCAVKWQYATRSLYTASSTAPWLGGLWHFVCTLLLLLRHARNHLCQRLRLHLVHFHKLYALAKTFLICRCHHFQLLPCEKQNRLFHVHGGHGARRGPQSHTSSSDTKNLGTGGSQNHTTCQEKYSKKWKILCGLTHTEMKCHVFSFCLLIFVRMRALSLLLLKPWHTVMSRGGQQHIHFSNILNPPCRNIHRKATESICYSFNLFQNTPRVNQCFHNSCKWIIFILPKNKPRVNQCFHNSCK